MRFPLVLVSSLVWCAVAGAQNPPIKAGLWESETVFSITLPPEIKEKMRQMRTPEIAPEMQLRQSCHSGTNVRMGWENSLRPGAGCIITNKVMSVREYAKTESCLTPSGLTIVLETRVTFESAELMRGTMRVVTMYPAGGPLAGRQKVTDAKVTERFLRVSCGSIALGSSVRVK
jgi:hypothetical protein